MRLLKIHQTLKQEESVLCKAEDITDHSPPSSLHAKPKLNLPESIALS